MSNIFQGGLPRSGFAGQAWPQAVLDKAQAAMPAFLLGKRWYPAKDAGLPEVALDRLHHLATEDLAAVIAVWWVTPPGQAGMRLFVPIAVVPGGQAPDSDVITELDQGTAIGGMQLVEAFSMDAFALAFVREMSRDPSTVSRGAMAELAGLDLDMAEPGAIRRGSAEQSNTSIRIGAGAILKVLRKLEDGTHPELEVGRFLSDVAGFRSTPAMLAWLELDGSTLAVLQRFVANDGDGWSWVLDRISASLQGDGDALPAVTTWLCQLGRRTAEMHLAFGTDTPDDAFSPEAVQQADILAWSNAARAMGRRALEGLRGALPQLDGEARSLANDVLDQEAAIEAALRDGVDGAAGFARTRHHGDYHLGQVLVTDGDAVIVDFEGEPLRPLAERRAKQAVLRDVAGMLRSLAYAAATAERALPDTSDRAAASQRLADWEASASQAFVDAYWAAAADMPGVPAARADAERLLHFFMLEKALYEIAYELANRPDWLAIPLRGVLALLDRARPVRGVHAMPFGTERQQDGKVRFSLSAPSHEAVEIDGAALGDASAEESILDKLALRMGIEPEFRNAHGNMIRLTADVKRGLLTAMGLSVADDVATQAALDLLDLEGWRDALPPAIVLGPKAAGAAIVMPAATISLNWHLALEAGGEMHGEADFATLELLETAQVDGRELHRRRLPLPADLPWGYHRLTLQPGGGATTLIVTPGTCWLPPAAERGERLWGVAAQLYLLRSATDWGIGDFGDLSRLVELSAKQGAAVIGLNPLHAMFHDKPEHASPYSPASRLLLNLLYIDISAIPDLRECPRAEALIASKDFRSRLEACRASMQVAYSEVTALKLPVLEALFDAFRETAPPARREAFAAFRREQGEVLQRHCLFLALREHFSGQIPNLADWHDWPEGFRDPNSPAVIEFAERHNGRIDFFAWMQWTADEQLGAAAATAARHGMPIGLYRDLAVGADRAGAETWSNAAAVVSEAQVGAPPDIFNTEGQDWGLPPFNPRALRAEGYRSFIELLRANMRHAGGLRIDHVMALQHLYWVPKGRKPSEGAYIQYPMDDMVGILALESHRHHCLVVGEDLGTVPEGFRERMAAANILSYRVLFFEQDGETGGFLPPDDYPSLALAVLGSHDLPTLRGWWEAGDIGLRKQLGLLDDAAVQAQLQSRQGDREHLLQALRDAGALPMERGEPDLPRLAVAGHAFLAKTPSVLAMVQIDDLTDESDPVNLPATDNEHPNWRRRLSMTLEELATSQRWMDVAAVFEKERSGG